jgi:hypothetical protein
MTSGFSDDASPPAASDQKLDAPKLIEHGAYVEGRRPQRRLRLPAGKTGWLAIAVLLLLVLAGSSPYWAPPFARLFPWGQRDSNEALAAIEQRERDLSKAQSALDQRIARLEDELRALAPQSAVKDIDGRLTALEGRPAGPDANQVAEVQADVQRLAAAQSDESERLARLEVRRAAGGERGNEALLLAVNELRAQLQGSQPFAAALGAVEALSRDRPDVHDALAPLASSENTGIPSMAVLTQRFEHEVAPALRRVAPGAASGRWGDQIMARLRALVVVHRVDESGAPAPDDPAEAAIANTQAALAKGDLAGAVKVLEALADTAAAPAQPWLAEARRRLAAEHALAQVSADLTARLAAEERVAPSTAGRGGEH